MLIPTVRPSHCPQVKDKQRKPAHAKETICPTPILHTHEKMGVQLVHGYNPLTQTLSVALPLYLMSKLRSLNSQTVTLENAFMSLATRDVALFPYLCRTHPTLRAGCAPIHDVTPRGEPHESRGAHTFALQRY